MRICSAGLKEHSYRGLCWSRQRMLEEFLNVHKNEKLNKLRTIQPIRTKASSSLDQRTVKTADFYFLLWRTYLQMLSGFLQSWGSKSPGSFVGPPHACICRSCEPCCRIPCIYRGKKKTLISQSVNNLIREERFHCNNLLSKTSL